MKIVPRPLPPRRDVECGDVVLTQVALSHSGRMLFVGTSNGTLRSMKFPLNTPGEWQEHQVSGSAVYCEATLDQEMIVCDNPVMLPSNR